MLSLWYIKIWEQFFIEKNSDKLNQIEYSNYLSKLFEKWLLVLTYLATLDIVVPNPYLSLLFSYFEHQGSVS